MHPSRLRISTTRRDRSHVTGAADPYEHRLSRRRWGPRRLAWHAQRFGPLCIGREI